MKSIKEIALSVPLDASPAVVMNICQKAIDERPVKEETVVNLYHVWNDYHACGEGTNPHDEGILYGSLQHVIEGCREEELEDLYQQVENYRKNYREPRGRVVTDLAESVFNHLTPEDKTLNRAAMEAIKASRLWTEILSEARCLLKEKRA